MNNTEKLPALSKTLFIPLAVRAHETENDNPLFKDEMAVSIFHQCDTENIQIEGGGISTHGILARTLVIDSEIKELLNQNPCAVIINLGAGLDTRFFRLDNGKIQWYDLDLPEVVSLRRQFISETDRLHFISSSVLNHTWVNGINATERENIIIIAEGLLMYFTQSEIKEILSILVKSFPKADLFFDTVHSFFVGKKISSEFLWGIAKPQELMNLNQNIEIVHSWSAGNLLKGKQSFLFRLLNILPSTKNRSQMIHLKLKG